MAQSASQIARELRDLRERAHLTQNEAAQVIGVTLQTISRWERGERRPGADDYVKAKREYEARISGLDRMGESRAPSYGAADLTDRQRLTRRLLEAMDEFRTMGGNDHELSYLRELLVSPGNHLLFEGGWTEPANAEEEMMDLEMAIAIGRSWLRRSVRDRQAKTRRGNAANHD